MAWPTRAFFLSLQSCSCFAIHMLSLNSFWWLIYGRVIINFDLVLNRGFSFLLHNVKHGSLRRDYLLSTRLNSNQAWPSRCYPRRCTLDMDIQILFRKLLKICPSLKSDLTRSVFCTLWNASLEWDYLLLTRLNRNKARPIKFYPKYCVALIVWN